MADYFIKYVPKYDLFTKEVLPFKARESYLENDFINKTNLKLYLKSLDKENQRVFCKELLLKRKEKKSLIYAPDQFYLKTLLQPPINYYENTFGAGTYNKICEEIGLKTRYNYERNLEFNGDNIEVSVDTRESRPLNFNLPIKLEKLDVGDYAPNPNKQNIFVERKSISDMAGSLSNGYERLRKEFTRAREQNAYIIFLIESKFSDILSINYLPHTKHVKASSDFLQKRIRDLCVEFPLHLTFLAVDGRKEAVRIIEKIFRLKDVRNLDLMYHYNIGLKEMREKTISK